MPSENNILATDRDDSLMIPFEEEGRRGQKSDTAYRTISEVAEEINVPQHVLRFWESKFKQINPMKRAGGRRFYRPQDIELIKRIHYLLYTQGYTIKGVQKLLVKDRQLLNSIPQMTGTTATVSVDAVLPPQAAQQIAEQTDFAPVVTNAAPVALPAPVAATLTASQQNDLHYLLKKIKELRGQLPV